MAIYHLEAKVVSRGTGRSAVAAAAYLSCSNILNDYDGVRHDYTRKKGLVWQDVFLPESAPPEWRDRSALWNAVEENEKTKDSRLAREFVPALPVDLAPGQWRELLSGFIQNSFVSDGMCADVAIHDPHPPGHNPHAHIMVTVRPLDEQGNWQYKTEKEYLCIRNGEERGFTAAEFKAVQADGWEKQYQYKVGKKKVYMAPSAAEAQGYERASKHPKSTKYGRQNPIAERWNSGEQLVAWRKAWADVSNRYLERYGHDARIDHRSHADRGLDEQPTIHEGVVARALEKQGIISDRCEMNRRIKEDNALLRELKATVKKLIQAVKNTIPAIAEAMEKLRENMIIFRYQLKYIGAGRRSMNDHIEAVKPELERHAGLVRQIRDKTKERKGLLAEKKETPFFYESFAVGRISEERFDSLLTGYEAEQKALQSSVTEAGEWLSSFEEDSVRVEQFLALAKKYADFSELTTVMINEFIEKIVIHAPERIDGDRVQEVEIHLRFIGRFELPSPELTAGEAKRQGQLRRHRIKSRERYWKIKAGEHAVGEPFKLTCKCCGEEFESGHSNTLFCSPKCRAKFYRQEAAESRKRECACENCGTMFATARKDVKYCCDGCRSEANRRMRQERYKAKKTVKNGTVLPDA